MCMHTNGFDAFLFRWELILRCQLQRSLNSKDCFAASQPINLNQTAVSLNGRVTKTDNVHPSKTSSKAGERESAWD